MSNGQVQTQHRMGFGVFHLPCLDCGMRRVAIAAMAAGALAFLLGWILLAEAATVFGFLTLWLAYQFASAPCCEEPDDE